MGLFILPRTNAAAHRHPQRTCLAALALACLLTANAGTLAGCASSHPITKSGEQCASCHSDGRAAVEGTGSASATETGLTFAVESGAGEVYLCTAAVAEDGTVIPSRDRTLSADELGAVTVSRPGLYALCTGDIASPSATVLIKRHRIRPRRRRRKAVGPDFGDKTSLFRARFVSPALGRSNHWMKPGAYSPAKAPVWRFQRRA